MDKASQLLQEKSAKLEPLSKYGFGWTALQADLLRNYWISGQKDRFVETANSLNSFIKKVGAKKLSSSDRATIINCAPTYHRLGMNPKGLVASIQGLEKLVNSEKSEDIRRLYELSYLSVLLDACMDSAEGTHEKMQRQLLDRLREDLESRNDYSPTDFKVIVQVNVYYLHDGKHEESTAFIKKVAKNIHDKAHQSSLDTQLVGFLEGILDNGGQYENLTLQLNTLDRRFGQNGRLGASIRLIVMMSHGFADFPAGRKANIINECKECLSNSAIPNGAIERRAYFKAACDFCRGTGKESSLLRLEELASEDLSRFLVYSKSLKSEADGTGLYELIEK